MTTAYLAAATAAQALQPTGKGDPTWLDNPALTQKFGPAILETLMMTGLSTLFAVSIGTLLGLLLVQTGTLEEVVADPATPLARELVPMPVVDSIPSLASQERSYGPGADAGVVLLDVVFTSHPGVPTGATVLRLASSMGADVTAGTFESLGSVQVGRLALTVPAYHADKIIEQLRKNNVHAEVRDQ